MPSESPAASAGQPPLIAAPTPDQVGRLARAGWIWSVTLVIGRQVLTTGATAIVSRHLSSTDYGVIAMVTTLTVLLSSFSDVGLSWATIQRRSLSRVQVDNLFWVNLGVGMLLSLACVAVAPLVAGFYAQGEITTILPVLGLLFTINGLTVQPAALMSRQMRLKRMAIIDLTAVAVGTTAAVIIALDGGGYWALVGQSLASAGARCFLVFASTAYLPARPRSGAGTRELVGFGGVLALNMINFYFARNLDNVVIGKVRGAAELGYYARAYFLMSLPVLYAVQPMDRVMIPALSALQHDRSRMAHAYRRAVRLAAFVGVPMACGLAVTAPEAVRLIYGPKWQPVVPILTWLSLAGVFQPIYNTQGWLFISSGKGRAFFVQSAVTALVLGGAFVTGVHWGGKGVAVAYAVSMTLFVIGPSLAWSHRSAGIPLHPTLKTVVPVVIASATMAMASWLAGAVCERMGAEWPVVLVGKIAVGGAVYLAIALRFMRPLPIDAVEALVRRAESKVRRIKPGAG